MNKNEIIHAINVTHLYFWDNVAKISSEYLNVSKDGKWSVAQNVDHINKSLVQFKRYLLLPKSKINSLFGLSNRSSISNVELISNYQKVLSNGAKATSPFIPESKTDYDINQLIAEGKALLEDLNTAVQDWEEEDFDSCNCPHPLLGMITAKEMFYFSIFHVEHHLKIISN